MGTALETAQSHSLSRSGDCVESWPTLVVACCYIRPHRVMACAGRLYLTRLKIIIIGFSNEPSARWGNRLWFLLPVLYAKELPYPVVTPYSTKP